MISHKRFIFSAMIFLAPLRAFASPESDLYIQQALDRYFSLPQDAATLSMGGSSSLSCQSSDCLFLNPAGLGRIQTSEASLSLGTGKMSGDEFLDGEHIRQIDRQINGTVAIPLHRKNQRSYGSVALGLSRYQGNTNDSIRTSPDGHRRSIAYGYAPTDIFSLGYSFTFYDDQLHSELADLHSHSRLLHMFGARVEPMEGTIIGGLFKLGIGQSDTEDFQKNSNGLSHLREYGAAVSATHHWNNFLASLAFDFAYVESEGNLEDASPQVVIGSEEEGHIHNLRFGLEQELFDSFFLRSGIRWYQAQYQFGRVDLRRLNDHVHGMGWSAGLGYDFRGSVHWKIRPRIDYGFEYSAAGHGGWEHLVTLSVPFARPS